MYEALAAEFNRVPSATKHREPASGVPGPLVFNTFQAYLRRTPSHLAASLERARAGGYMLGVKLVRGAYVGVENATWASKAVAPPPQGLSQEERDSPNRASPVWASKALTDACFDGCALRLVEEVAVSSQDSRPKRLDSYTIWRFVAHRRNLNRPPKARNPDSRSSLPPTTCNQRSASAAKCFLLA